MTQSEINKLLDEAYEHLWNGRFRMALPLAEKVFDEKSDDSDTAICYAWALLENGDPVKAMEHANLAVELKGDSIRAKLYRGYLLMRMSIFEGSISDLNQSIDKQRELLGWSYMNKARALAGLNKFDEAKKSLELALLIDSGKNADWKNSKKWFLKGKEIFFENTQINPKNAWLLLNEAKEAIKEKEYWYALLVSRKIQEKITSKKETLFCELIELEAMFNLFQFRPAMKKAEELKPKLKKNEKFMSIYNALLKYQQRSLESKKSMKETTADEPLKDDNIYSTPAAIEATKLRSDSKFYPNKFVDFFSANVFDVQQEFDEGTKKYYSQFNAEKIKQVGIELIFNNPAYKKESISYRCKAVWYINDFEIGKNDFVLSVKKVWDSVIFAQTWGADSWKSGQGKVEIYFNGLKVVKKWFGLADESIIQVEEPIRNNAGADTQKQKPDAPKSYQIYEPQLQTLDELLAELNSYIGLQTVKKSVRDFIDYIEFVKERRRLGLKSEEGISINSTFLGNPGTGKTTIARLLGKIFKAMGILSKGHVVEVDRAALVGQYVGETAQKTERIITEAKGGVLLIDEAYTLVKKGGAGQDFGQEAVDILLKRMEDNRNEFVVIAAGYPEEMDTFLNSNPGLKSRFAQNFIFDDFAPDELMQIFELMLKKEEYSISESAKEIILKEFFKVFRKRDKTFGNARLARRFFDEAKLKLSKRFIKLTGSDRTKEALTTIIDEDVKSIVSHSSAEGVVIPINEEALTEAMNELNSLIGLDSIKKEVMDLIKLARYYHEQNENLTDKFGSHILFLGNPGTGKTTVARIFSKIYSALGILAKGHLVEIDRQGLVAGYIGQTAEKTTAKINEAMGGTLFIDEAYSLVTSGNNSSDFGKEAIDTLLKRMEDDRGKFIVIAAGYTDEMKKFVESNPGIQSRFNKTFTFEDYSPDELFEITQRKLTAEMIKLSEGAEIELKKYYNEIFRNRDKAFGNGRTVRDLVEKAKRNMLLRLADLTVEERKASDTKIILIEDIIELLNIEAPTRRYEIKGDPEKLIENMTELNNLVGLENIKASVDKLIGSIKISKLRKERGFNVMDKSLHSVFIGNPGTGKTTVARILSKIYKEMGLLEKGHLVEVSRADLVAGYQGQTAIKTDHVIEQALGGMLFIDEAYTLVSGPNDFGIEAINTLLKRMEDYEGQFIVIVGGYPDEMKYFIDGNPGLKSRFTNFFLYDDYNSRQLLEIAVGIADVNGYKLDEGALQQLLELFDRLYNNRDKNFGNARTAKNILYKAISNQEERIAKNYDHSDEDLNTLIFEDFENITPLEF
ncbi:MAG: AAA family ATPase [bacterium]